MDQNLKYLTIGTLIKLDYISLIQTAYVVFQEIVTQKSKMYDYPRFSIHYNLIMWQVLYLSYNLETIIYSK